MFVTEAEIAGVFDRAAEAWGQNAWEDAFNADREDAEIRGKYHAFAGYIDNVRDSVEAAGIFADWTVEDIVAGALSHADSEWQSYQ